MEEYIEEALAAGFIQPSTSPATSGFSFVEKRIFFFLHRLLGIKHHNPLTGGGEWKTMFLMAKAHYEYLVMLHRLTNAPMVFQSFVNEILKDHSWVQEQQGRFSLSSP